MWPSWQPGDLSNAGPFKAAKIRPQLGTMATRQNSRYINENRLEKAQGGQVAKIANLATFHLLTLQ
jgi:hypothetical protein